MQVKALMDTSHFEILYVCNGDNARSPLAAMCTAALAKASSDARGVSWKISSAGCEEAEEAAVRSEALRAAQIIDLDLSAHRPSVLAAEQCDSPDLILAMSWDQISHIWSLVPNAWDKVFTMKEFVHWAKLAPSRPPILFADRAEAMRDKVVQAHAIRKRARSDHGFWGGIRPQDLNLIEPNGKGDEVWATLAHAVKALASDVITLLVGPKVVPAAPRKIHRTKAKAKPKAKAKAKAKARR
jgi:protein-tyrosine-phosphatase